ncbi:MAG TPA: hypothetical protein VJ729_02475 [Nitrososphaeraceae archaeon]|nr:hypothetical protein [Nitrososphaeraceae archaeon]
MGGHSALGLTLTAHKNASALRDRRGVQNDTSRDLDASIFLILVSSKSMAPPIHDHLRLYHQKLNYAYKPVQSSVHFLPSETEGIKSPRYKHLRIIYDYIVMIVIRIFSLTMFLFFLYITVWWCRFRKVGIGKR